MDRLVCGDVGYGKTEVAARGAFKVIEDGWQVAVLVPTTVLAEQHAATFRERFAGFPVEIACLNRFRTAKEQREIVAGLASGTNWVFRDESCHMAFAFEVIKTAREEEPDLFDDDLKAQIVQMMSEAVDCEVAFAEDTLSGGVAGLSIKDMRQYLEYCADQRMAQLGMPKHFGSSNPFPFMDLQDVQELTNFFERRVSAYQVGVQGEVGFDHAF